MMLLVEWLLQNVKYVSGISVTKSKIQFTSKAIQCNPVYQQSNIMHRYTLTGNGTVR
jgi:hypothetical protein